MINFKSNSLSRNLNLEILELEMGEVQAGDPLMEHKIRCLDWIFKTMA